MVLVRSEAGHRGTVGWLPIIVSSVFNFQLWRSQDVASNETNPNLSLFACSHTISIAQFVRENKLYVFKEINENKWSLKKYTMARSMQIFNGSGEK